MKYYSFLRSKILFSFRVRKIAEDLFQRPEEIAAEDVRFLEFLLAKLEKTDESSFTVLALSQLLGAIQSNGHHELQVDSNKPYSRRRKPRRDPIREVLPDYYVDSPGYSKEAVDGMLKLSSNLPLVGFSVRAGLAQNSLDTLASLMDGENGRFLIVSAEATDREGPASVRELVDRVGEARVLLEMKERKGKVRVPLPKEARGAASTSALILPNIFLVINAIVYIYTYQISK